MSLPDGDSDEYHDGSIAEARVKFPTLFGIRLVLGGWPGVAVLGHCHQVLLLCRIKSRSSKLPSDQANLLETPPNLLKKHDISQMSIAK